MNSLRGFFYWFYTKYKIWYYVFYVLTSFDRLKLSLQLVRKIDFDRSSPVRIAFLRILWPANQAFWYHYVQLCAERRVSKGILQPLNAKCAVQLRLLPGNKLFLCAAIHLLYSSQLVVPLGGGLGVAHTIVQQRLGPRASRQQFVRTGNGAPWKPMFNSCNVF